MRWAIQKNLGPKDDPEIVARCARRAGAEAVLFTYVPFSDRIPKEVPVDENPTVFYGSTNVVNLAFHSGQWSPCAFFDPWRFSADRWADAYGSNWLNHEGKITTLAMLAMEGLDRDPEELLFVRPVSDLKDFKGGVWSYRELRRWQDVIFTDLTDEEMERAPILVAPPRRIEREWRLFMIDGKVCEASQYRYGHHLNVVGGAPQIVRDFAEECATIWQPHEIFVLDVCWSGWKLWVLELGCMNSAGFYQCSVDHIVREITRWIETHPSHPHPLPQPIGDSDSAASVGERDSEGTKEP